MFDRKVICVDGSAYPTENGTFLGIAWVIASANGQRIERIGYASLHQPPEDIAPHRAHIAEILAIALPLRLLKPKDPVVFLSDDQRVINATRGHLKKPTKGLEFYYDSLQGIAQNHDAFLIQHVEEHDNGEDLL